MIEWLYRSAWELSILVTIIVIINPVVRRTLNARVAYWLWLIPLATVVLWDKPVRPETLMDINILSHGGVQLRGVFNSDTITLANSSAVIWVWGIGCFSFVLFRVFTWLELRRLLSSKTSPYLLGNKLKAFIPIELTPQKTLFFRSNLLSGPFVTGIPQAKIYLPTDFEKKYSLDQQKWILIHELTHIKRRDLWAQLVVEMVKACFWFNPILYIATAYFREDQELACDYQALKNCSMRERAQYGEAMLREMSANLLPATLAFFTLKKERFIMLQKHKKSKLKNAIGGMLCFGLSAIVLTEAPSSIAVESSGTYASQKVDNGLSLQLEGIPLEAAVKLITQFMQKDLENQKILGHEQIFINVKLDQVQADMALDFVLSCNNFSYVNNDNNIQIIRKETNKPQTEACRELNGV